MSTFEPTNSLKVTCIALLGAKIDRLMINPVFLIDSDKHLFALYQSKNLMFTSKKFNFDNNFFRYDLLNFRLSEFDFFQDELLSTLCNQFFNIRNQCHCITNI
ncbi:hypothetical protein BpHYR1_046942 [Brachionus plicatilis]|uniref:Uncharacterized protein n=1 Tax=Brachionus plicatilis TaxID=10195 RepID=A0A3M7RGG3_BRAPC|nr:hypothetical protein BpHYR1_046942 [Brachionus plicatilis]